MRPNTLFGLLANLLLLASVAWSSPDIFEDLIKRDTSSSTTTSATQSTSSSNSGTTSTATTGSTTTGSGTTSTSTDASATASTNGTTTTSSTSSTSISVNPEWPEGGASITNPATTITTYYKIGNNVTFGWNYTSVEITPTAVNVIASCSSNSATYTLARNASFENTTSVVWNTDGYGPDSPHPLLTAHYTLIIYESGTSPTEVASPGQLGPASHTFGMYVRESYTALNKWVCVTCSAAMSDMERQAFGFMLTMVFITIASFTVFASGSGLFL